MTREEAIKRLEWLEMVAEYVDSVTIGSKCTEDWEAYNMAIAALREQEEYEIQRHLKHFDIKEPRHVTDINVGNKWISVEERLPTRADANHNESILAIAKDDGFARPWIWDIVERYYGEFTYWMPMPKPPKEEV